jgi:hypothetical protein
MKIAKLFIPGSFEDAYIYRGQLIVLTEERSLRVYSLNTLIATIEKNIKGISPILTYLFLRNDWLGSEQFKMQSGNVGFRRAFLKSFELFPQPYLELSHGRLESQEETIDIDASVLLDMSIYNGRMYIGADTGFYHLDLDWDFDRPGVGFISQDPVKRLDARCLSSSAKYGAVNASCGDNGLFTFIDEFGSMGLSSSQETKTAERSVRTAWLNYDLINYADSISPTLLKSDHESVAGSRRFNQSRNLERERTVLTDIGHQRFDLSYLIGIVRADNGNNLDTNHIQYVYNSSSVMFVHTSTGNFYSLGLKTMSDMRPRISFTRTYKGPNVRILSARSSRVGLVIETDDRVLLFANSKWIPLVDSEVLSVRTFPSSRRFQNVAVVTNEEGVFLISMFDEESHK